MEGFKKTEIGWIPEDWEVDLLKEISNLYTGNTPPTSDVSNYGVEYLFVSPADLGRKKYISNTIKKLSKKGFSISRKFPKGSILFTCIGSTIGKCGISGEDLTSNQQINSVVPLTGFSNEYLYYYLLSEAENIKSTASEQAVPIINKSDFGNTLIKTPPLPEQEAIAKALSDVDSLIDTLERKIAKKRNIKQGAMQRLLTGKQRLPGFSGDWVEKKLGEIASINMGQSPLSEYYNNDECGLPLIQGNADIQNRRTIKRIYTRKSPKECEEGDLILTVRAPVGNIAKSAFKSCIGRGVCSIKYDNDFLYQYFQYIEPYWAKYSKGSTFDSINKNELSEIVIKLPMDFQEQTAIAQILTDMDNEIATLEQKLDKYKQIKQGMMQELLTGRIRLVKPQ